MTPTPGRHDLPIDPDVDPDEDLRHHAHSVVSPGGKVSRWPRLRADVIAVVFAGGCVGGLVRYLVAREWPTSTHLFPWPTFTVNIGGAFVLAVLIVLCAEVLPPSRYVRPLVGTGFCGALTTFSSVVVSADQLIAHGHALLAVGYLAATVVAGLAAAAFGLVVGRSFAAAHGRSRGAR